MSRAIRAGRFWEIQSSLDFQFPPFARRGCLEDGVAGLGGDAALVVLVTSHLDVAAHAPGPSPGVADEPVVLAARAVADDGDAVVEVVVGLAARGVVVDAACFTRAGCGGGAQRQVQSSEVSVVSFVFSRDQIRVGSRFARNAPE